MTAWPLISCVCVTRNRPKLLARAIACFLRQTYPARELVVVFENDDVATPSVLQAFASPAIRSFCVPAIPKQSLGSLRNTGISFAQGALLAQWDDDDWYSPERLMQQAATLQSQSARACVLSRWIMADMIERRAYASAPRAWEGSLLVRRDSVPTYPDLARGEDTPVVQRLIEQGGLVGLDRPDLYIYTVHDNNTWDRSHWSSNLRPFAVRLPPDDEANVFAILESQLPSAFPAVDLG